MAENQLRPFQLEDLDTLTKHDYRALIANSQGTGKTVLCLSAIARDPGKLLPVAVVCPASVVRNWRKEARQWTAGLRIHLIEDTSSPLPAQRCDMYILSWSLLGQRWKQLVRRGIQLVIADECHFAKNELAYRSVALNSLASRCPHLLALSGTPIINETEELDAILTLFGSEKPVMIRRLLEDVAKDVPPKTRAILSIELPPRIAARYRSAEEDFEAWLEREMESKKREGEAEDAAARALAAEALVKIGYLRRILAVGKVYAAADFTARLVRAGEPVVLFAEHKAVIQKLTRCLRRQHIPYVLIDGGTSPKERHRAVQRFQKNRVPVFIGSKAAKEGLTLTAARHLIFVERYWTPAEEEQGEDRIRRIGQLHPTKIWFPHVTGTVDDRIAAIIERKRRIVKAAIGSADIKETPEKTVAAMLSCWSDHAGAPLTDVLQLGLSAPLPPLPPPRDVYMIQFTGKRWIPLSALRWCRMMGYTPVGCLPVQNGYQLRTQPPDIFEPGQFKLFRVAQDITAFVGKRRDMR